jgi:hypothetical protein
VAVLVNPDVIWRDPYEEVRLGRLGTTLWWSALAIPVVGYISASAMTMRGSTTRVGQGMLIGLTVMMPAAVAILFGLFMSRSV